jgi:hypothetical protein
MLQLIVLMVVAYGLMLGLVSRKKAYSVVVRLILVAAFAPVLIGIARNSFQTLPWDHKLLVLAIAMAGLLVVLARILLGSKLFTEVAGHALYDVLKALFLLPFRVWNRLKLKRP